MPDKDLNLTNDEKISSVLESIYKEKQGPYSLIHNGKLDPQAALKIYYDYLKSKNRNKVELEKANQKKNMAYVICTSLLLAFLASLLFLHHHEIKPSTKKDEKEKITIKQQNINLNNTPQKYSK